MLHVCVCVMIRSLVVTRSLCGEKYGHNDVNRAPSLLSFAFIYA